MKKALIITLSLLVTTSILMAFPGRFPQKHQPQSECEHREKSRERAFHDHMIDLKLSDAQQEQFEKLQLQHQKNQIDLHSDIEKLELDFHKARKDHDFNEMKSISKTISEKKYELNLNKIEFQEDKWNLLNSEQKDEFDELRKKTKMKSPEFHKEQK